jgi:hypothetical protein
VSPFTEPALGRVESLALTLVLLAAHRFHLRRHAL